MLSEHARQVVKNMYLVYRSYRKVARVTKVSDKTVRNIILDDYVKDKKKPGPKSEITRSEERAISREITKLIKAGSRITASKIQVAAGLERLSTRTVQRKLAEMSHVYLEDSRRMNMVKSGNGTRRAIRQE